MHNSRLHTSRFGGKLQALRKEANCSRAAVAQTRGDFVMDKRAPILGALERATEKVVQDAKTGSVSRTAAEYALDAIACVGSSLNLSTAAIKKAKGRLPLDVHDKADRRGPENVWSPD